MSAPKAVKLGPGVLTIGEAGSEHDVSCLLSKSRVDWDKDKEDDLDVLCGGTIAGSTTYSAKLKGTIVQDLDDTDGIVQFSWDHKGEQHPFVFVPSSAAGRQVTGQVIVDPLSVGGDEVKKNMLSDFEWDCVGEPDLTPATPATGAAAGTPGDWTPAGSVGPGDFTTLEAGSLTASPTTAWTTGQHVYLGDGTKAHWDATNWVSGVA